MKQSDLLPLQPAPSRRYGTYLYVTCLGTLENEEDMSKDMF
jgi:hypothetical protein